MFFDDEIAARLRDLGGHGQLRRTEPLESLAPSFEREGKRILNFSTNDYLGLQCNPHVLECAAQALAQYGSSSSSSRLMSGTSRLHEELEQRLAEFFEVEATLLFGAGYLANLGTLASLVSRHDYIFADKYCHASLLDGARLSGAKLLRFRHNDAAHLEELLSGHKQFAPHRRFAIVTESVFSMDGDLAPLVEIAILAEKYDTLLIVDEAHALGIFGRGGNGCIPALNQKLTSNLVRTGTLSKAFASYGGVVAGSSMLREFLINTARTFIFNTALPPACVGAALGAMQVLASLPGGGEILRARATRFRSEVQILGFDTLGSESHIVPIVIGDNEVAMRWAEKLAENDILCRAIRPPTVPPGTARLRFSLSLQHEEEDIERLISVLRKLREKL